MSELAATTGLFAGATDDAPGGGAAMPRIGTGILPYQTLVQMVRARDIQGYPQPIEPEQIQPASIDLRLGRTAYRVRASFLPGPNATVMDKIKQLEGYPIDLGSPEGAVLETGCVYVVPLQESLTLPSDIHGVANPKSSTGRLDILTRLIADRSNAFDEIERGYDGPLYLEIAPQTFSIVVRPGARLNQARFQRLGAALATSPLRDLYARGQLAKPQGPLHEGAIKDGLVPVTIDLVGAGPGSLIGYRARKHTDRIDLEKIGHYDPTDFWEPITYNREPAIVLDPDAFYILVTREEVGVPPDYAGEMVPYYTRSGEYRVHYAGFFDPGFGWDGVARGSKAVLEVRSHDVPFMLEHGQTVGWLRYDRMAARPDRLYGAGIKSNYQNQGLALAKQFRNPGSA
ncbi:MAG: 2'-deoxycytidine 5'-triphosphate deaminase [Pseudomonadota bacterium]